MSAAQERQEAAIWLRAHAADLRIRHASAILSGDGRAAVALDEARGCDLAASVLERAGKGES